MRRTLILGIDQKTKDALVDAFKTEENIINSGIIGFLEDEPQEEVKTVFTLPVFSMEQLKTLKYDAISILNTEQYEIKRKRLIYGYGVPTAKISGIKETMYLRLFQKYRDTQDPEIQETMARLERFGEFDTMCTYCPEKRLRYEVKWDGKRNLPYVMFYGKKLFYPRNYAKFAVYQGKQWVSGIEWEQQPGSPHTYITGDITIEDGDVLVDAGVCEGNFAIRFIDRLSKLYLVESDPAWAEPLQATFEPYKDKVVFCNKYLSDKDDDKNITLDTLVGDGRVDFLKMDVEGFEKQALSGAKKMFAGNNVKSCICTYHRHGDEEAIKAYFEELGYQTKPAAGFMCFPYEPEALKWTELRRAILYAKRDEFTGKAAPAEEIAWGGILWESDMKKPQPVKKEEPKPTVATEQEKKVAEVAEPEKKVAEEAAVTVVAEKAPEKPVNVKSTAEYWAGVADTRNSYNYRVGAVLLYIPKKIRKLFQKK